MNTEWELKEKSTGTMTVTVDGEDWKKAVDKAFRKLGSKAEIKGFRKGQVPAKMLEKIIPERERWIEAVNDNANEWLRAGLDDKKLDPISRPMLDVKDMDADHVAVTYDFAVRPEVEMGEYKGLDYTVADSEVSDDELNAELDRMRKQYADMEVKDGEAADGDTVNINYEGFRDGVAFEGGKAENYNLTLGSHSFIPGFEEQLVGMKDGDKKEIKVTFPTNYVKELAGKEATFKVAMHEVKEKQIPELNDEAVKDLNIKDVSTVAELQDYEKKTLLSQKVQQAENAFYNTLVAQIVKNASFVIDESIIQNEAKQMEDNLKKQIEQNGLTFEQYLDITGTKAEDLQKTYLANAENNLKEFLALHEIGVQEKLDVTDADVDAEIKKMAEQYKMKEEEVRSILEKNMDDFKNQLADRKVRDFVMASAKKAAPKAAKAAPKAEKAAPKAEEAEAPKAEKKAPAKKAAPKKEDK